MNRPTKNKKRIKLSDLLKEDVSDMLSAQGPQEEAPINDISLDQKVDHFLVQYERESVPTSAQFVGEGKKFKPLSLRNLMKTLFEADEPAKPPTGDEADEDEDLNAAPTDDPTSPGGAPSSFGGGGADFGGGDLGSLDAGDGDATGGGAQGDGDSPLQVPAPKINISNFSRSVARLVDNFESIVNPKRIMLNRARAYLEKNYNPAIAKEFLKIMDTEYNLSPESLEQQQSDMEIPYADRAMDPLGGT